MVNTSWTYNAKKGYKTIDSETFLQYDRRGFCCPVLRQYHSPLGGRKNISKVKKKHKKTKINTFLIKK